MTRSAKARAQAAIRVSAAFDPSSKRRRNETKRPEQAYSTRELDWKEQKTLGEKFAANGEGVWPVEKIVDQRQRGGQVEYQVSWEPHPLTGERWQPDWVALKHLVDDTGELLAAWKEQQSRNHRSFGSRVPVRTLRSSSHTSQADSERPPLERRKRSTATRIVESSSSDPELVGNPLATNRSKSARQREQATLAYLEVQETQPDYVAGLIEVRVPALTSDRRDWETLRSSSVSLYDSALSVASPVKDICSVQQSQSESQLSKASTVDIAESVTSSAFHQPIDSPAVAQGRSFPSPGILLNQSAQQHCSSTSYLNKPFLRVSTGATAADNRLGSTSRTVSPTETLSDLSFSSRRRDTTPRSASSTPASFQLSNSTQSTTTQAQPPPSAQQLFETANKSQNSIDSLRSFPFDRKRTPSSTLQVFQPQVPFERSTYTEPASPLRKPSSYKHYQKAKLCKSIIPAPRLADSPNSSETVKNLGQDSIPLPTNEKEELPDMASTAAEHSPRVRSATPTTDRNSDGNQGFGERVRRARNVRSEAKSPGVPPVRQATPLVLGINTSTSPNSSKEAPRQSNQAVQSPLKYELEPSSMGFGSEEPALVSSVAQQASIYDTALGSSAMPVHRSVEDESTDPGNSNSTSDSGKMQIQQSIESEQLVSRTDGTIMPTLPIFGPGEYAVPLLADGRVQSIYNGIVRSKKKALLKFIRKRPSGNTGSATRTPDSIEMAELISRLNDTVTHLDLALDDIGTQYDEDSDINAKYAVYASSKFAFLDLLIDELKSTKLSILILAKPGRVHTLLESFLVMKRVARRRPPGPQSAMPDDYEHRVEQLAVDLVASGAHSEIEFESRPTLIIAFDATFDIQSSPVKALREKFPTSPIPIIHLLVTNSSEHVDRCLPVSMPSPQRLRLLVRASYQASGKLGGGLVIEPLPSEFPDRTDLWEVQKILKKSPERRLKLLAGNLASAMKSADFDANFAIAGMPELEFDELEESPKSNRARSITPLSGVGTPALRKRMLEIEGADPASTKRQRLTPLHDVTQVSDSVKDPYSQLESAQNALDAVQEQLATEKEARLAAETARDVTQQKLDGYVKDLAGLQHRYEKRTTMCHELQKKNKLLDEQMAELRSKHEKSTADHGAVKEKVTQLENELAVARSNLLDAGGDAAALETAQNAERSLKIKNAVLEKSLTNTTKDFEFTRTQYQEASNRAFELATQVSELETHAIGLQAQASDEKRQLREMNYQESVKQHLARIAELDLEKKNLDVMLRKLEEEVKVLKKNRGVQTRGSSVQPPGSPGGRSRQGSPALGHLGAGGVVLGGGGGHVGNRASVLRYER